MSEDKIIITYWQKKHYIIPDIYELLLFMKNNEVNIYLITQLKEIYVKDEIFNGVLLYNAPHTNIVFFDFS